MTRKEKENNKKKYRPEVCQIIQRVREKFDQRDDFDSTMAPQLDLLAIWYQVFFDAFDELTKNGLSIANDRDSIQKNPIFDILRNASTRIEAISTEFGLTPQSFKKLIKGEENENKSDSPLAIWIKQQKESIY